MSESREVQKNTQFALIRDHLTRRGKSLRDMFPPGLSERQKDQKLAQLTTVSLNAISQDGTGKLLACSPQSWYNALAECIQLNLIPSSVNQFGHLVPYDGVVTFQPGYRGFIQAAYDSGNVEHFGVPKLVYEKDGFELWQEDGIDHVKHMPCLERDPGDIVGVYVVVRLKNDPYPLIEHMRRDEIDWIMSHSKPAQRGRSTPWKDYPYGYGEMAKKSVVRRMNKRIPTSERLAKLETLDNNDFDFEESIDVDFDDLGPEPQAADIKAKLKLKMAPKRPDGDSLDMEEQARIQSALAKASLTVDQLNDHLANEHDEGGAPIYGYAFPEIPASDVDEILGLIESGKIRP